MRIRIGSYWLAGDPTKSEREHSSAEREHSGDYIQQGVAGLRWPTMQFFDRGNDSEQIIFSTTRLFASYDEANDFIFTYGSAHPRKGTVSFRYGTLSEWKEYDLPGALISRPVILPIGVSLRLKYTVQGGAFVPGITSASSSGFDILQEGGGAITAEDGSHLQTEH